jgi:N-acetylglucosaminylphosphatidylinositol deacetylase
LISKFQLYSSKILIYYDGLVTKGLERAEIIPPGSAPNIPPHFFTPVFVSGAKAYTTAFKAMLAHKSQLVWFRWLHLLFSRYMWVNEWTEVEV